MALSQLERTAELALPILAVSGELFMGRGRPGDLSLPHLTSSAQVQRMPPLPGLTFSLVTLFASLVPGMVSRLYTRFLFLCR